MKKLSIILLFSLLLVACGGADESAPTQTESETIEPSPTGTAVAEPIAGPTESEAENTKVEEEPDSDETETAVTATFQLEAWADNWFAAYLGEELIVEDSVSITTERSFNAETATFEASYPLHLNFILKDFGSSV